MGDVTTNIDAESIEIQAVVIRADGTREELGVVAEYHKPDTEAEKGT